MYKECWKLFEQIEEILTDEELDELLACEPDELNKYHFGLGLWIRNRVLTPDSQLYKSFINSGLIHKDDMSNRLIDDFYWYLKFKRLDEQYRD